MPIKATCTQCGIRYKRYFKGARQNKNTFCTRACLYKFVGYASNDLSGRPKKHDLDRIWAHVKKTRGCWEWTGFTKKSGYGHVRYKGKLQLPHRIIYTWEVGPIPSGMSVCHRCDNPRCVRPSHLFAGTHQDNMRDAVMKGRLKRGANRGSTLELKKVRTILSLFKDGKTIADIARATGVSSSSVRHVCRGTIWKGV